MKKILPYIIPFLPVLFLLIIFLEISIPWADNTYDLGRLLQCALIWLSSGICFALPNSGGQKLSRNQMIILISLFSLIILDIFQAKFPIFAVLDAAFLVSLFAYFPILKNSMPKIAPKILDYLALTIGLLPIWIIIWLLLSYAERLSGGIAGDHWHMGFRNIRQYDDTLLPCLILLWHVAQKYSKKFQMVVCLVASLYLTSLFIDGARAVILSLIVGGVFTFIIKFKLKKQWLILPIASAVGGWVIWQILQFADNAPTIELTRTTTSALRILCCNWCWNGALWG